LTSASDYKTENTFIWCTGNGTTLGSSPPWNSGEPSGKSFFGAKEDCVEAVIKTGPVKNSVLNDVECTTETKYICEVHFQCIFSCNLTL
jgi:hypothetical protein